MKKLAFCLVLCVVLTGCGAPTADETARELLGRLDLSSPSLTADVTADYGDRVYSFRLKYAGGVVTILSPDSIAGIEALVGEDGFSLRYDGAEVFTGSIGGISPMSALPLVLNAFAADYISDAKFAPDNILSVTFRIDDNVALNVDFDRETELPISAEVSENGEMKLKITFYDVKL